jgi:hypothetical protein
VTNVTLKWNTFLVFGLYKTTLIFCSVPHAAQIAQDAETYVFIVGFMTSSSVIPTP